MSLLDYPRFVAPNSPFDLHLVASLWALGELYTEAMPDIAAAALVIGLDSPSLRKLAGENAKDRWGITVQFQESLYELEFPFPNTQTASLYISRYLAHQILNGSLELFYGLYELDEKIRDSGLSEETERQWIGAYTVIDDIETSVEASFYTEEFGEQKLNQFTVEVHQDLIRLISEIELHPSYIAYMASSQSPD